MTAARPETRHLSSAISSSNASACTRSKHVVLASFGEPEEYHTVSLYFASKFPDTAVHHLLLYSGQDEKSKDSSQRKKTATDWRAFYRSHGIHRAVVDMSSISDYHKFREDYLHSSVNDFEYELMCFARFIGLRDFCKSKGIDQLTWIDADIPVFDSEFLEKVCLPQGTSTWALTSGSSFINTMACSDIARFVDFTLDFYARENRHALVRAIHAHGSDNMASATHISEQVRRAEPAFAELGIDPKHFSDMFLFSKFLQDTSNAMDGREEQEKKDTATMEAQAITQSPQVPSERPPKRAYIHQEQNNGTIDPYFLPILSIRNEVPQAEIGDLCVDEEVWNRYYSLRRSDATGAQGKGGGGEEPSPSSTTTAGDPSLKLSFNQSGTWVPIAGAHFQGDDCKARLLSTFSKMISSPEESVGG